MVAIPVVTDGFYVMYFSVDNTRTERITIRAGQDLMVVGYPLGYHDKVHNLPVFRSAMLASIYPVPFEGKPLVLIDARLHSGTSGSPVLVKPTSQLWNAEGTRLFSNRGGSTLVGVHSAAIDERDRRLGDDLIGLNYCWFASLIPEIIEG